MSSFPADQPSFLHAIQSLSDAIEKTDSDESLAIFSYRECCNTSPDEVKRCRGVVVDTTTAQPLFRSLGYAAEYTDQDWPGATLDEFASIQFYRAEEGTLLRLFFASASRKWYLSTHRKLDASRSRWSAGKPFGVMFEDALFHKTGWMTTDLTSRLDPAHVYLFLVRSSPETRIVCTGSTVPTMFHVGTILNGQQFDLATEIAGIGRPERVAFETPHEVVEFVRTINPYHHQGVIGFYPDGRHFKVVNSQYHFLSHVRGNEPSVAFRYLQVRCHPVYSQAMFTLYPEHVPKFQQYEQIILYIAKRIHNAYIARFVKHHNVVVSQEEYRIVRDCHGWHLTDRAKNRVTLDVVMQCLSQPKFTSTLNAIIRAELKPRKPVGASSDVKEVTEMTEVTDVKDITEMTEMTEVTEVTEVTE